MKLPCTLAAFSGGGDRSYTYLRDDQRDLPSGRRLSAYEHLLTGVEHESRARGEVRRVRLPVSVRREEQVPERNAVVPME